MDVLGVLGTIFSGGITGVIGSALSAITKYSIKKLEYKHEEEMSRIELEHIRLETEKEVKITESETKQVREKADADMKIQSYLNDRATYSSHLDFSKYGFLGKLFGAFIGLLLGIVDFARGAIRPASTIYFEVFMFIIWTKLGLMVGGLESLPKEKLVDLFYMVTLLVIYCAITCVTWWFGHRIIDKIFLDKFNIKK